MIQGIFAYVFIFNVTTTQVNFRFANEPFLRKMLVSTITHKIFESNSRNGKSLFLFLMSLLLV